MNEILKIQAAKQQHWFVNF